MKLYYYLIIFFLISCQSKDKERTKAIVRIQDSVSDNKQYSQRLKDFTREVQVYDNFETKVFINATYFSSSFKLGLKSRFRDLFGKDQIVFIKDDNQIVFLVLRQNFGIILYCMLCLNFFLNIRFYLFV